MSSGQPSVENGHSCEENHVSSTSSSWVIWSVPHSAHASGRSTATVTCPSGQYQAGSGGPTTAGVRCSSRAGCRATPRKGAASVGSEPEAAVLSGLLRGPVSSLTFTNHWGPASHGSISLWQR